jgi:hypothetical protein
LQYTLEYFLKDRLDPNGILITDDPQKEGIIIGKDIKKPFSKSSLIIQLEKLNINTPRDLDELIEELVEEFKEKLIKTIKDYNGKE